MKLDGEIVMLCE